MKNNRLTCSGQDGGWKQSMEVQLGDAVGSRETATRMTPDSWLSRMGWPVRRALMFTSAGKAANATDQ